MYTAGPTRAGFGVDPFPEGTRHDYATQSIRRRRFLSALNWGWLGMGALALLSLPFYPQQLLLLSVILGATLPTFVLVRFLAERGHVREAGVLFVLLVDLGLFGIFVVQAREIGIARALESQTPPLMMMGLAVLFAGALVEPRAPFLVALLNSLLLGALVFDTSMSRVSASSLVAPLIMLYGARSRTHSEGSPSSTESPEPGRSAHQRASSRP
jgi:hypothetical protein